MRHSLSSLYSTSAPRPTTEPANPAVLHDFSIFSNPAVLYVIEKHKADRLRRERAVENRVLPHIAGFPRVDLFVWGL